jgi:hypothetical protein
MNLQDAERRLAELAPQIARKLGWQLVPRDDRHVVEMETPAGWHVYFNAGWQGGYDKLSISPGWPRDDEGRHVMSSYNAKVPRINVSLSRSADAIGNEIARRLVPEWSPMWEAAMERLRSTRKHEGTTRENAMRLAEIVGVDPREIDKRGKFSLYRSSVFPESLSDVEVSGTECKLELRCTLDEAEEILRALVKLAR